MLIGVTGARGWVGNAVCASVEAAGHTVRRFGSTSGPGVTELDLRDFTTDWLPIISGCGAIIHCAGHVHRPMESVDEQKLFRTINVDGFGRLLHAAKKADVPRIVLVSTIAVYDWSSPEAPRHEHSELRPATHYGWSKLHAENLLRESTFDWRIGRLATVFGVGDKANFLHLAKALKLRRFAIPGMGSAEKSVISVRKAGDLIGRLVMADNSSGLIMNLASPEVPCLSDICHAFTDLCGFPKPFKLPGPLMKGLAIIGDGMTRVGISSPLTSKVYNKLVTDTVVDVALMKRHFPGLDWPSFRREIEFARHYYSGA